VAGGTPDVIEIDAASNGLVDDARELREKVRYAPLSCRYKVMIIDEVHMMSNAAFNALLKTLEEPPAHTIFILATTESHKVPATIVSRCQRFDFRRIPVKQITERLALMAAKENIQVSEEAFTIIARGADGGLRDAQSLLDQIISFKGNDIEADDVVNVLGLVNTQVFIDLVDAISNQAVDQALSLIDQLVNQGADLRLFMKDWVDYWRALVLSKVAGEKAGSMLNHGNNVLDAVKSQCEKFGVEELVGMAKLAASTDDELRRSQHPRVLLELFLIQLCQADRIVSIETLWSQLQGLEKQLTNLPEGTIPANSPINQEQPKQESSQAKQPEVTVEPEVEPSEEKNKDVEEAGQPSIVVEMLEDVKPESYFDKIKQQWPTIMEAIGQKNKRIQALLRDVVVSAAEEGWLELTCVSDYHQTGLNKEDARKVIESVLEDQLSRSTRLRLKVENEDEDADKSAAQLEAGREKEFEEVIKNEPLVQKTLDMFGGKIVDVIKHSGGGVS